MASFDPIPQVIVLVKAHFCEAPNRARLPKSAMISYTFGLSQNPSQETRDDVSSVAFHTMQYFHLSCYLNHKATTLYMILQTWHASFRSFLSQFARNAPSARFHRRLICNFTMNAHISALSGHIGARLRHSLKNTHFVTSQLLIYNFQSSSNLASSLHIPRS